MNTVSNIHRFFLLAAIALSSMLSATAWGGPPEGATLVSVKSLCPVCGKKIVQKLEQLPQTQSASINVDQRIVQVVAKPGHTLSPRQIWEIVEKGGEQPVRLQGPSGTFTTKPQR